MSRSSSSHLIAPWQSKTDVALSRRGASLGSPTIWTLLAMVGVLLGITPFVKVDRTVTSTSGKIVSTEGTNTFQAFDPSIIKSIDVKEGEEVKKGQLLATLDATFATADVEQLRHQMAGLDALIARATAEQGGPLFVPHTAPDRLAPYQALQVSLFEQRSAQLSAQLLSFDEKIRAAQASIIGVQADQSHLTDRVQIAKRIEAMRDSLYKNGSTSLLNLLQANDSLIEMERSLENQKNTLAELQHQITSLQADRDSAIHQWYSASSQELIAAEGQRDATAALLEKAMRHQEVIRLVAKEPSVVLTLTKLSAGSVLRAGDPVLSLIPLGAPVEAEIQFSADDIGFVRPGDLVTLKVDAFSYVEHGSAAGHLAWISEGSFTSDSNGQPVRPFYRARVTIEKRDFINVPSSFRLIPGMTLEADMDVGRRSLFRYVIGTVFHGMGEAFREP